MAEKMLVNRATGLVRAPIIDPKRKRVGKTAKDRAKRGGIPAAPAVLRK